LECDGVALIADPNRGVADCFAESAASAGFQAATYSAAAYGPSSRLVEGRIFRVYRPEST